MSSRVSTDNARCVVVMPAYADIQAVPRFWIPASAGMTFPLSSQAHGIAFNRRHTLYRISKISLAAGR